MGIDWTKYPDGEAIAEHIRAAQIEYKMIMDRVYPRCAEFNFITVDDKEFYRDYWLKHKRAKPSDFYTSVEDKYHHKSPPRAKDFVKVNGRLGIILWVSREDDEAKVLLFKTATRPEDDDNFPLDAFETARHSGRVRWVIQW